jgi:hypothetical protein
LIKRKQRYRLTFTITRMLWGCQFSCTMYQGVCKNGAPERLHKRYTTPFAKTMHQVIRKSAASRWR